MLSSSLLLLGSLTLRFGGTRKKMLVNWISHSSGRYRDPTFGHQKWTFFGFASKKWNHLARTTLTDFVTSRDVTEPIKPVRWRFGLRALALRGGSSLLTFLKNDKSFLRFSKTICRFCAKRSLRRTAENEQDVILCPFVRSADYNHSFPYSICGALQRCCSSVVWH